LRFWAPLVMSEDDAAYRAKTRERGPQDRQESVFFTHLANGTIHSHARTRALELCVD
jgi:hypothetical protein